MTTDNDDITAGTTFSRRHLMGAAGATTLGLAALGGTLGLPGVASAEGGSGEGTGETSSPSSNAPEGATFRAEAFPAVTAGTEYLFLTGHDFQPKDNTKVYTKQSVGVFATGNAILYHVLSELPKGARITEVVVELVKDNAADDATIFLYRFFANDAFTLVGPTVTTTALPAQAAAQYLTMTPPNDASAVVDGSLEYQHVLYINITSVKVNAVRVGYIPVGTATFVPITPYRAYDSRLAGVPSPGILARLTSRQVNVLNAIGATGAVTTANVIPASARAITYNLTATGTTGDNYLAIAPGTAASTTVSSINFAANQSIANAATVSLDSGTVKVFCGDNVGSSHFIVDVTGYYI